MDFEIKYKKDKEHLKKCLSRAFQFYSYIPYKNYPLNIINEIIKNLKPNKKSDLVECLKKLKWSKPICFNLIRWAKELSFTIHKGYQTIEDAEIAALEILLVFTQETNVDQNNNYRQKLLKSIIEKNLRKSDITENNLILFIYPIFLAIQGFICTNVLFFSLLPELDLIDFNSEENILALFNKYIVEEDCFEDYDQDEFYISGYKELIEKKTGNKVFFNILKRFLEYFYNKKFPRNFLFDEGNLDDFLRNYNEKDKEVQLSNLNLSNLFQNIPEFCSPYMMIFTLLTGETYEESKDKELKDLIPKK